MRLGELFIVRVSLASVKPADLRAMGSVFKTSALSKESLTVNDAGVIQINLRATKVGAERAEMEFVLGATDSDRVSVVAETHVEMSKEELRGQLLKGILTANIAYHAAIGHLRDVSPPYREGWENVKETLEKAGEGDPFNEIVVHLALTFIAGLAGGRVVEIMIDANLHNEPLTEGLKELALHVTDAGLHSAMPKSSISKPLDPAGWVDAVGKEIEVEAEAVNKMLLAVATANEDDRAGFFRDIDIVADVNHALTFGGQPIGSLEATPIPKADDFERMIWKGWMVGYHGNPDIQDAHAWSVITNRLESIDEDSWEFIKTYLGQGDIGESKKRSGE